MTFDFVNIKVTSVVNSYVNSINSVVVVLVTTISFIKMMLIHLSFDYCNSLNLNSESRCARSFLILIVSPRNVKKWSIPADIQFANCWFFEIEVVKTKGETDFDERRAKCGFCEKWWLKYSITTSLDPSRFQCGDLGHDNSIKSKY